jgi:hypothetical protein
MEGSIYVLTRKVDGERGAPYLQNVMVFAGSADEARVLVRDEFARLRRQSSSTEHAYRDAPAFDVDRIALDEHKLLTSHITR